jgi:hypothetical protein
MPSFDIESFDIESFDIESLDIASLDIESFDIESFFIESSFDIESFFMSSAKALGANASPNDRVTAARTIAARLIMLQNLLEDIFQLATGVALLNFERGRHSLQARTKNLSQEREPFRWCSSNAFDLIRNGSLIGPTGSSFAVGNLSASAVAHSVRR